MSMMLKRAFSERILTQLSSLYRFNRIDKFSKNSSSDEGSTLNEETTGTEKTQDHSHDTLNEEKLSQLLKDAASHDADDKNWSTPPYPAGSIPTPVKEEKEEKSGADPRDRSIVIFPGQGILKVGSVEKYLKFPGAKEIFEIANEILGYDLLKLCLKGPQEKLDETKYNQVATVVSSLAALEQLREERPAVFDTCVATAGYSVGELSALIFSGAISLEDGIRLVAVRGNSMQYASHREPQGMLSVYCTPKAELTKLLIDAETWARDVGVSEPICKVSVYLYTQCKILAGHDEALKYVEKYAEEMGLKNLKRLPVSGAFHTLLMEPALKKFYKALNEVTPDEPRIAVYSNYTATPYRNSRAIKKLLLKQIVGPVKWEQSMQNIYTRSEGIAFPRTFDVGSNGRMKTILKLINVKAASSCISV